MGGSPSRFERGSDGDGLESAEDTMGTRASAATMGDVAGTLTAGMVSLDPSFVTGERVGTDFAGGSKAGVEDAPAVSSGTEHVVKVAAAVALVGGDVVATDLVDGGGGAKLCLDNAACVASLTGPLLLIGYGICDGGLCKPGAPVVAEGRCTGTALVD